MNFFTRTLTGAAVLTASSLFTSATASEFRPLESPANAAYFYVFGLSPNGNYVVLDGDPAAYRWDIDQPAPQALPMLPSEYPGAMPLDVNDMGVVVGMSGDDYQNHAVRWLADGSIEVLPTPFPHTSSEALHVSATGDVIVGDASDDYRIQAVRWVNGVAEVLPLGSENSMAQAVSADGAVVVGEAAFTRYGPRSAFRWSEADGLQMLFTTESAASDVSADGSVIVGFAYGSDYLREAFRWTAASGVQMLGDLPGGDSYSRADAVSGDGTTIVGSSDAAAGSRAIIWTETLGMRDLNEWLPLEYGLDLQGWTLTDATDISVDGSVIIGVGTDPSGGRRSWLVRLSDDTPPDFPDSDGDGMADDWELQYGLDPYFPDDAEMDFDGDGLTNRREFETGNDPHDWDSNDNGIPDGEEAPPDPDADSDGDGIPDGWETLFGLDPYYSGDALWDMDGDLLTNLREYETGNHPHNPDTDGDGIPDGDDVPPDPNADSDGDTMPDMWEAEHGLDMWNPYDAEDDNDGDWLWNVDEFAAGSDPHNPDTDGDGLEDSDEYWRGLDAANPDTDGDTLPDGWEVQHDLDAANPADGAEDRDGDMLTNADEYHRGTDIDNPDSDEDRFMDGDEVQAGTDPLNPDSDADGMPDGWEVMNQFDPVNPADAEEDADFDGVTNGAEYAAGSDPYNFDTDSDGIGDGDEAAQGTSPVRPDTDQDGLSDSDEIQLALDPVAVDTDMDGIMDGLEHGSIVRVSIAANGDEGWQGAGGSVSVSANGRFVVFQSASDNLVPGDTNGVQDVFVRDVHAGTLERVSVGTGNVQANGSSWIARHNVMSADGRYVVFRSGATNLAPGYSYQIYLHDRATGETTVLLPESGSGNNNNPVISADGRHVAFESSVPSLTGRADSWKYDVMWLDRETGETRRVTETIDGASPDKHSNYVSISGDGRTVAYSSDATNLVPGDTNNATDVFVRDVDAGVTMRINAAADGTEGNGSTYYGASLTTDGRKAVFSSLASNLVPGDTNNANDAFMYDLVNHTIERVSVRSDGAEGTGMSTIPSVSADGRYVSFASSASNFSAQNCYDIQLYVRDLVTGAMTRVSAPNSGDCGNDTSGGGMLTADGSHVAFFARARNLVPGDNNYEGDVFIRTLAP